MDANLRNLSDERLKFYGLSLVLFVLSAIFTSVVHVALSVWMCVCGYILVKHSFLMDHILPSILTLFNKKKKGRRRSMDEFSLLKKFCPVCGAKNCPRHRPELNILALQPWTDLMIPKRVDDALEELLSLVLRNHVYTWYRDISEDEAFVDELKCCIRYVVAVLLRRLKKLDVSELILHKLVRASIRHIDCYMLARKRGRADIQEATLDTYGGHVHIALRSRQSELDYLKNIVNACLPYLVVPQALQSRSMGSLLREIISGSILLPAMDVIADPDIVNKLLLIYFDRTPSPACLDPPSPSVNVLSRYNLPLNQDASSLHLPSLSRIMDSQEALYPFMQFLKSEASVHVLTFCLAADEFNQKILDPELTSRQRASLHEQLCQLYTMYLSPESVDKIQFSPDIVQGIKDVCDGPPDEVVRLQTSTPLFRAYEHAYDLLETTFLPLFHQSDAYYIWLCGNRHSVRLSRNASNRKRSVDQFGLSKIGTKLKDVFKGSTIDGKLDDDVTDLGEDLAMTGPGMDLFDSLRDPHPCASPRDLSTWRVTIPRVQSVTEPDTRRGYHVFVIEVRRLDVMDASCWTVLRRYTEFYILEQKLREFHGESLDARLPAKKTLGAKGAEFMESRRLVFEQYLQSLLTKPYLKGSEMLYNFLTSDDELTTSFLPEISLGRMFKAVPMKLVKERGQNLETFLDGLVKSVEPGKPRPGRMEDGDSDTISINSENLANPMYENNANLELSRPPDQGTCRGDANTLLDAVIYLAQSVWHAPSWFLALLLTLRTVAMETLDDTIRWYLSNRIVDLVREHRLETLIHLLRDVLYFDDDPPRTERQKHERRELTLLGLKRFLPGVLTTLLGDACIHDGSAVFLDVLQHPKLNKQLTYVYLDILVDQLFPELTHALLSPTTPPGT